MGSEANDAGEVPVSIDDAAASALRADLAAWTVPTVSQLVGDRAVRALDREQIVPARLAARRHDTPVALLTRLFSLGDALPREQAERALPTLTVDGAQRCGLVAVSGPGSEALVKAAVDLRPYTFADAAGDHTWWVASDLGEIVTDSRLKADHVLGIGGASATLASATAHVIVDDACFRDGHVAEMLPALQQCVAEHFDLSIEHSTFQIEPESSITSEHVQHD